MTIEQTSQLILLILNSVLMLLLSAALLGGAWLRQQSLASQLQQVKRRHGRLNQGLKSLGQKQLLDQVEPAFAQQSAPAASYHHHEPRQGQFQASLKQLRAERQRLQRQYRWSRISLFLLHAVLVIFAISLLALALRSLFFQDSLVASALVLFTLGAAGLLAGMGCLFMDVAQGNGSEESLAQFLGQGFAALGRWWQRHSQGGIASSGRSRGVAALTIRPKIFTKALSANAIAAKDHPPSALVSQSMPSEPLHELLSEPLSDSSVGRIVRH